MNAEKVSAYDELQIIMAKDVEEKEVKWLWYPYIPYGKITLLHGDPGDGKSKLILNLIAILTRGESLPFTDEVIEPIKVIYQTTEDGKEDTVVPRFNASGGNGDNLIFICEDYKHLSFGDIRIRQAIEQYGAKLLVLDPLSAYISEGSSMNNANDMRTEFNSLIEIANDTDCSLKENQISLVLDFTYSQLRRLRGNSLAHDIFASLLESVIVGYTHSRNVV